MLQNIRLSETNHQELQIENLKELLSVVVDVNAAYLIINGKGPDEKSVSTTSVAIHRFRMGETPSRSLKYLGSAVLMGATLAYFYERGPSISAVNG